MTDSIRRIDPEEDIEEVELPELMEVGISQTGVRFHLLGDDGHPVCDRGDMMREPGRVVVRDAREKGYAACRSCFRPEGGDLPDRVIVAIGGAAESYHKEREGVESVRPACNYGSVPHDEMAFVEVGRASAELADLDPCQGCFGAAAPHMEDACPLCGEQYGRELARHIRVECPAGASGSDGVLSAGSENGEVNGDTRR